VGKRDQIPIVLFTGAQRLARGLRAMGLASACLMEPGEKISSPWEVDYWIEYDPWDLAALDRWAARWPEKQRVAAVLNRRERRVMEHAVLNQALQMPGIRPWQARIFRDKLLLRELLEQKTAHLNPPFREVQLKKSGPPPLPFPFLLKPRNLFKSQLITACRTRRDWEPALEKIRSSWEAAQKRHGVRLEPSLLAEEELEGSHFSLDGFVTSQGNMVFSPPVPLTTAAQWGLEDFHISVRWVDPDVKPCTARLLEGAARDLVEALELRATPFHIDLVSLGERVWILDAAPRVGGYRSEMMELAWGCSLDLMSLKVAMGESVEWEPRWEKSVAVVELFPGEEGVLQTIEGLEEIRKLGSFYRLKQRVPAGERVGWAKEGFRCPVFVILVNPDMKLLQRDVHRLREFVRIRVSPS
jgi:hypothetical protein